MPDKILIKGVTQTGETFRPSDWAERMCGQIATVRNHRVQYSDMLYPVYQSGLRCVLLDKALKEYNEQLYQAILRFAQVNKLMIEHLPAS